MLAIGWMGNSFDQTLPGFEGPGGPSRRKCDSSMSFLLQKSEMSLTKPGFPVAEVSYMI